MSEIIANEYSRKNHKKINVIPRVDLTPMVDLGFLLLTFFVFSSTISLPNVLPAIYPDDRIVNEEINNVKQSGALSILLGANNHIYYYEGFEDETGKKWKLTDKNNMRQIIMQKKLHTPKDDFVVLIKPGNSSNYNDLVGILDEMNISQVDRFSIVNTSNMEEAQLNKRMLNNRH